ARPPGGRSRRAPRTRGLRGARRRASAHRLAPMIRETAPAKVNLVLHVGPRRADGLHQLCSLFASLELADEVTVEPADSDEVVCPGVGGPNLAEAAIEAFRAEADLPPLRVTIEKRI